MKEVCSKESIATLSELFGKSRQGYYTNIKRSQKRQLRHDEVIEKVDEIRKRQPRLGTDKLQYKLNEQKGIHWIGRDQLYDILRANGRLIKARKRRRIPQTNGNGQSLYPDLRKGVELIRPNQLWCSDITYIELNEGGKWCYLLCITDEYSHKILGYSIGRSMRWSQLCLSLQRAKQNCSPSGIERFKHELIFHSDRGSQFKSNRFQELLSQSAIRCSMTAAGKSYENPVAERLNGILKHELLAQEVYGNYDQAEKDIVRANNIYNEERPHKSCGMLTPSQTHRTSKGPLKKLWRQRKKRLSTKFSNIE